MARRLGSTLPPDLLASLSQRDLPVRLDRAFPVVTLDAKRRPHPMLCSYLEVLAVDRETIRVVINASGRSARNLSARRAATLVLVEPERTVYVKCRSKGKAVARGALARFTLKVKEVLEDAADPSEGDVRITSGITYGPAPSLDDPRVRATLEALRPD